MRDNEAPEAMNLRRTGLYLGPSVFLLMLLAPAPDGMDSVAWHAAAAGAWMAIWWMTEAVAVAVTALLPIVLFPILGISDIKTTTASYAHPIIYLFLGGFLVALATEKWNLHKRIALNILLVVGSNGSSLIAGFMLAGALLSMWVTNTATTMMLLPIALAIITVVAETNNELDSAHRRNFEVALLLSIAYAATIGGMATLIGTPPNALLAAFMEDNYNVEIGFGQWMAVGLPLSMVMLPLCWWVLTKLIFPFQVHTKSSTREVLISMRDELGPMKPEEKRVSVVFLVMALSWIFRPLLTEIPGLSGLTDQGIAVSAGLSLFLIPASEKGSRIMDWETALRLPWGILILFGGGLSLAAAVSSTGLAQAIGQSLAILGDVNIVILVVAVATLIIFLTELTSNLATTATFLPVVATIAAQAGQNPLLLAAPAALAASCAFMLPVATPPNAIVYSSGRITIPQMTRAGVALNILGITFVSLAALFLVPVVLGP
jgi:sodium-dependent dicarboxylate transporter 2/3/5